MIRSMTGFGQALRQTDLIRIQVDMKSVNHRYGEIVFRMPREWLLFEDKLRKRVNERVKRGRVDVFITAERSGVSPSDVQVDWTLVEAYQQAAEAIGQRYAIGGSLTIAEMMQIPGIVQLQGQLAAEEEIEQVLCEAVDEALDRLCKMREAEGANLKADLHSRLSTLHGYAKQTFEAAPQAVAQYRDKLRNRLSELLQDADKGIDENRFVMEVALMAERTNIDEEITRLDSHIAQFSDLLAAKEPVGRKLDFLLQEMNREVNTIGSKAGQSALVNLVVDMKAELEKMREQVQNIE